MKFNDKIAKFPHFKQANATKKNFIPFIDERKPVYSVNLYLLSNERRRYQKIVYYINKKVGSYLNNS
jgi:hypothetical protein